MSIRTTSLLVALGVAALSPQLAAGAPKAPAMSFHPSVRLTEPPLGGFEPSIQVDRFNTVYVTAHKEQIPAGLDPQTQTGVRAASFLWTSTDGKTFRTLSPEHASHLYPGAEGDLAIAGDHLYFVDTNVADIAFARWRVKGPGRHELEEARPATGTRQAMDDRPWVTATSSGTVLYVANAAAYALSAADAHDPSAGDGVGTGRWNVYVSRDHGTTFSNGLSLKDSGWCHAAADKRPRRRDLYVVCRDGNDPEVATTGTLYVYSSHDDGRTWSRSRIGQVNRRNTNWPSIAVSGTGDVHVLSSDDVRSAGGATRSILRLYNSADGGRTFRERQLPAVGSDVPYAWMSAAPNGDVGLAYYGQASPTTPWYLYAHVIDRKGRVAGGRVTDVPVAVAADYPVGDFFQVAFGPDNKLNIAFTVLLPDGIPQVHKSHGAHVYFVRQR